MKVETRNTVLKLIYLAALGSIWSTAVLLVKSLTIDGRIIPFDAFSLFLCVFGGYGAACMIDKLIAKERVVAVTLLSALPVLLPGILVYSPYGDIRVAVETILLEAAYFTGTWAFCKNYAEIAEPRRTLPAIIITIVGAITALLYESSGYTTFKPLIFLYIYLFIIITFILKNQKIIDFLMNEMVRQTPKLPVHIRSFNFYITVLAASVLSLLAFAGPIAGAARAFFKKIAQLIGYILSKPINLFFRPGTGMETKDLPKEPMKTLRYENFDERVMLIVLAVIGAVILVVLALKLPRLFRDIKKSLAAWISRIKAKLSLLNREKHDTNFYDDEVEFSKAVFVDEVLAEGEGKGRAKRTFPGKDPALQVRYYYSIVLDLLISVKIKLSISETTGEIFNKAAPLNGVAAPMDQLTKIYDRVRYDDFIPEPDASAGAREGSSRIKSALSGGALIKKHPGKKER